jgi:hypothetical protein
MHENSKLHSVKKKNVSIADGDETSWPLKDDGFPNYVSKDQLLKDLVH